MKLSHAFSNYDKDKIKIGQNKIVTDELKKYKKLDKRRKSIAQSSLWIKKGVGFHFSKI